MSGALIETSARRIKNETENEIKRKIALRMLKMGKLTIEKIAECSGLSVIEFDLCVLFGNLLDNALEACGRIPGDGSRFVHIKAGVVKKCFLIEIQNSMGRTEMSGNIRISDGVTGKDDPRGHGIGLSNVKDVVNRYHGVIKIETGDAVFMVSVLIPSSPSVHDIKQTV